MNEFIGSKHKRDSSDIEGKELGVLMKIHFDLYLADEFEVVEEFMVDQENCEPPFMKVLSCTTANANDSLLLALVFYQSKTEKDHHLVTVSSVDHDGDQRISVYTSTRTSVNVQVRQSADDLIKRGDLIFIKNGILKGAFFDLQYNFISRDKQIDLIAWDENVKEALWKDIISFQKAMPKLRASGVPNSRGVILAGPPGTGKTMIAKWLAAHSEITCILISAEMITGRNDIKSCFGNGSKVISNSSHH